MKKFTTLKILCIFALALIAPLVIQGCNKSKEQLVLDQQFKIYYEVGENLNVSGGILKYVDKDGEESFVDVTSDMVSGFTTENVGTRKMIITYNQKNISVSYSVFKAGIEHDVWYMSQEKAIGSDRNYFAKFDLIYSKFLMNTAEASDMPEYLEDNGGTWLNFTKSITKDGIILTVDQTIQGVRYLVSINDAGNGTFTMSLNIGSLSETYTFAEFVD